jgi:prevent-host-death family protein
VAKRISLADAKATFSAVVDGVLHRNERYVIERHGKGVAALVSIEELQRIESSAPGGDRPAGALALVGAWEDVDDAAIDAFVADVRTARDRDTGRKVRLKS